MSEVTYVDRLPDCQIHTHRFGHPGVPAMVDGRTMQGHWAYMCQSCHERYGIGLGTGKGQRFVIGDPPEPDEDDVRAALMAAIESGDFEAFEDACGDRDPMEFL